MSPYPDLPYGLCACVEQLREHLRNMPKMIMQQQVCGRDSDRDKRQRPRAAGEGMYGVLGAREGRFDEQ